jgi:hypothetical protein
MYAFQNIIARSGTAKQSKQPEIVSLTLAMTSLERIFKKSMHNHPGSHYYRCQELVEYASVKITRTLTGRDCRKSMSAENYRYQGETYPPRSRCPR